MKNPVYFVNAFYYVADPARFEGGRQDFISSFQDFGGVFGGDNLVAIHRNLGFLRDKPFMEAFQRHVTERAERAAIWRTAVLVWAARQCLRLDGDFVECGCYQGTSARILADVLGFKDQARRYFLYDLFEHDPSMPHHALDAHGVDLHGKVSERFSDLPNVRITKGRVPDSLALAAPELIAFMHLDLNNAEAEVGALEVLWDRMAPGAILILDDFGWIYYRDQHLAETDWFAARGYSVLELPTGQGMVIK